MLREVSESYKVSKLFEGWQETLIWSCLQGVMGHIYIKDTEHPVSAVAVLGDFCFLAGVPDKEIQAGMHRINGQWHWPKS